jgi:hypothetical protein
LAVGDPIFVRPRHEYEPYTDFYKLVELSGYELTFFDKMEVSDPTKTYVYSPSNGEIGQGWQGAKARLIWWQLEWEHEIAPCPPGVSEKWTSDKYHADYMGARFVPMGSHPDLNLRPSDSPTKEYDVTFLAAPNGRRYSVWGDIADRGLSVAPNGWNEQRHSALSKSRAMVIVHQWEQFKCIAPLRWALAAAYKLPVISESVYCRDPFTHSHFMTCDIDRLGKFTELHIRDPFNNLSDYGLALHNYLCNEMTFRKSIEAAL